jgi:hypothetical protein
VPVPANYPDVGPSAKVFAGIKANAVNSIALISIVQNWTQTATNSLICDERFLLFDLNKRVLTNLIGLVPKYKSMAWLFGVVLFTELMN